MDRRNCRHKHLFVSKKDGNLDKQHIVQLASIHTELVKHSRTITENEQHKNICKNQKDIHFLNEKNLNEKQKNNDQLEDLFLIPKSCIHALPKDAIISSEQKIQPHIEAIQKFGIKTKNTIEIQNIMKLDKKEIKRKKYIAKPSTENSKKITNKMKNDIEVRISLKNFNRFIKKTGKKQNQISEEKFFMSHVPLTKEQCVFLETLDLLRNQSYIVNCRCSPQEIPSSFVIFQETFLRYLHNFINLSNILLCPPICSSISRKGAFWNPKPQYWYFHELDTSEKHEYIVIKKGTKRHTEMDNLQFMFEHPCVDYKKKFHYFFIECNETKHIIACAFTKSPNSNYTVIYSHQNACDIGDNIVGYPNINDIALFLNCDILCYDYSGYGISGGKPSEDALKDNIVSLIDYVNIKMSVPLKKIILLGFSLGGAVSTIGATARNVGGLITMAAPASISQVIKSLLHCGSDSKGFEEFEDESPSVAYFNTSRNIRHITCPFLGIHAYDDKLVPISHAKAIYRNCLNHKFYFFVHNSNHNYLDTASEVWLRINEYLYLDLPNINGNEKLNIP